MDQISADKLKALEALVRDISAEAAMIRSQLSPFGRVELAKSEISRRRMRERIFSPANIFNDPAWDILLELYVADAEGIKLTASSICIEAKIPQTTIIRWIGFLESLHFIERKKDRYDKRRNWIVMTKSCRELMARFFSA